MVSLGPARGRSSFRTLNTPTKLAPIKRQFGASWCWRDVLGLRIANASFMLAMAASLCGATLARAAPCDAPTPIVFAPGTDSAEVRGASPRGTPDCWTLQARAGQHLSAQVQSPGNNVVFQIYRPGSTIIEGAPTPESKPLHKSVSEGKDARSFSGKLPETGAYLFVLGARWGGSEYKFQVKVTK